MEGESKIIKCLNCKHEIRLPSKGHIHFLCPECGKKFEFENGEPYVKQVSKIQIPEVIIPVKKGLQKKKPVKNYVYLILVLLLFIAVVTYWFISKDSESSVATNVVDKDFLYTDTTLNLPTTSSHNSNPFLDAIGDHDSRDSIIDEKIKELAKELSKEVLKEIMEKLTEEAEDGQWEKANERFDKTIEIMKEKGKKGEKMMVDFEKKLAQVKNLIVNKDPNKLLLPDSKPIDPTAKEKSMATNLMINKTIYSVTIYYSGPTSKIVTIVPGGMQNVILFPGNYNIAVKVNNPRVRDVSKSYTFAGFIYPIAIVVKKIMNGL